jgi:hypothetical protein
MFGIDPGSAGKVRQHVEGSTATPSMVMFWRRGEWAF